MRIVIPDCNRHIASGKGGTDTMDYRHYATSLQYDRGIQKKLISAARGNNEEPGKIAVCMATGVYLFRLRATTKPAAPNPINASVPGSGTATLLPPLTRPDGIPPLQAPGLKLHSGLSANREVDIVIRSATIIVFIITLLSLLVGKQALHLQIPNHPGQ
jgi:hypothetical protein